MKLKVKIKRLTDTAIIPSYARPGDGCFDLHYDGNREIVMFSEQDTTILNTGLAFEIPYNHVMLVFSRSGQGFNYNTRLSNCVGIIDSQYRGEVMIKMKKDKTSNTVPYIIQKGDKIAQAMIIERPLVEFIETDELSETERGTGGFGHTDNKGWL